MNTVSDFSTEKTQRTMELTPLVSQETEDNGSSSDRSIVNVSELDRESTQISKLPEKMRSLIRVRSTQPSSAEYTQKENLNISPRKTLDVIIEKESDKDYVDRCSGKFRCTWTVSLEDSAESKFSGGFFLYFSRAFLSRGFALALYRAEALPRGSSLTSPLGVSSGFKSPSKATHNEWLETTRTTFRIEKLFWMTIVEQLSMGRVWQEEGERNGDASWSRRGTDPALISRLRMTYTTMPLQDFSDQ
uniref:CUB domain-containing protein n=1 Tax=Heterorhabditis bacteriophora TaxID=37862 RepID=A0A1I7WRN2_HETBA